MKRYNLFFTCLIMAALLVTAGYELYSNENMVLKTENRNATTLKDIKKFTDIESFLIDQFPKRDAIISVFNENISAVNTQVASVVKQEIVDLGERYFVPDKGFYTTKLTDLTLDPIYYEPMLKAVSHIKNQTDVPIYFVNDARKYKHSAFYEKYDLKCDYEQFEEGFIKALPKGITFIDIEWKWEDVLKFMYKTDHHLNHLGTIDIYTKFMEAKGAKNEIIEPPVIYYEGARFYGSDAKGVNKYDVYDEVYGWDFSKMNFKFIANDNEKVFKNISANEIQKFNDEKANYYAYGFAMDYAKLEIFNPDQQNGKKLLIIGESYTNSLNLILAYNYSYIMDLDLRFYEGTFGGKPDIKKLVQEKKFDEILIYTDIYSTDSISINME